MPTTVPCPICDSPVVWGPDAKFRPFCSERCRQIDLGAWANGDYTIPVRPSEQDDDWQDTRPQQ